MDTAPLAYDVLSLQRRTPQSASGREWQDCSCPGLREGQLCPTFQDRARLFGNGRGRLFRIAPAQGLAVLNCTDRGSAIPRDEWQDRSCPKHLDSGQNAALPSIAHRYRATNGQVAPAQCTTCRYRTVRLASILPDTALVVRMAGSLLPTAGLLRTQLNRSRLLDTGRNYDRDMARLPQPQAGLF